MMSATGSNRIRASNSEPRPAAGFTLVELILVMALLTIVLSLAAPSLAHFFRGRGLDSEVQRFLGLTRYGQSRAVSEGMPMVLWIDEQEGSYGLEAENSYSDQDPKAVQFDLATDIEMEVELPAGGQKTEPWKITTQIAGKLPAIRFTPDGFIGQNSPDGVWFRQVHEGEADEIWVGLSRNRLNYEIQTNQPPMRR